MQGEGDKIPSRSGGIPGAAKDSEMEGGGPPRIFESQKKKKKKAYSSILPPPLPFSISPRNQGTQSGKAITVRQYPYILAVKKRKTRKERKKLGRRRNLLTTQDTLQQDTPHRATSNAQPVFFLTSSTVEPSMSSISLRPLPFSTSNTHSTKRKKESKQARKKEIENDLPLDLKGEE